MPWLGVGAGVVGRRRRGAGAVTLATLTPSGAWAGGLAGAGLIAPPALPGTQGSGHTRPPIGGVDRLAYHRVTAAAGDVFTVQAVTADRAYGGIAYVDFHLEGGTQRVTALTSEGGIFGWQCRLKSGAVDGVANLVIDIVPTNGPVRRVVQPVILDTLGTLTAARAIRYVNSSTGNDANTGLTPATAWASIRKATHATPADGIIYIEGGTHLEVGTSNPGSVLTNTAPVELRARPGTGAVTIAKSGARGAVDSGYIRLSSNVVKFTDCGFDCSTFMSIYPLQLALKACNWQGARTYTLFSGCTFTDPNNAYPRLGSADLYYTGTVGGLTPQGAGSRVEMEDCTVAAVLGGVQPARSVRCVFNAGQDVLGSVPGSPWLADAFHYGNEVNFWEMCKRKLHTSNILAVLTSSFDGTNTVITVAAGETLKDESASNTGNGTNTDYSVELCPGGVYGGATGRIYSIVNSTKTIVLPGNVLASYGVGVQFRLYTSAHVDAFQVNDVNQGLWRSDDSPARNIFVNGYKQSADAAIDFYQPLFPSLRGLAGLGTASHTLGSTTVTIGGVTCTISAASYDAPNDRTTLTIASNTTIGSLTASDGNRTHLGFITGALAGQTFPLYSMASTSLVVQGNASAAANGDTCAPLVCAVDDFIQVKLAGANLQQWRRVTAISGATLTIDAAFPAAFTNLTTAQWAIGKSQRDFAYLNVRAPRPADASQTSGGLVNVVVAQCSFRALLTFRTAHSTSAGFGAVDTLVENNVFGQIEIDSGTTFPAPGLLLTNNAMLAGTNYGTGNSIEAGVTFDAEMRPTGLTKTVANVIWPRDALGNPVSTGSLVGAAH